MPAIAAFCTSSKDATGQRQSFLTQRPADHLVDRVVAPDVLAHATQLPARVTVVADVAKTGVCREYPGRVHAPGPLEKRLGRTKSIWHREESCHRDAKVRRAR